MPPADAGAPDAASGGRQGRCRKVRPPSAARALFAGFAGLLALTALACLLLGLIGLGSGHVGEGAALVGVALVIGGLSWLFVGMVRRAGPALTMTVCPATVTMSRNGRVIDTIQHAEVGLILIKAYQRSGVTAIEIYGSDRSQIGRWDTNWGRGGGALRAIRPLRRLQYPWALHEGGAVLGGDRFRSRLAPGWADEVIVGPW
jgi:hypothetical protein